MAVGVLVQSPPTIRAGILALMAPIIAFAGSSPQMVWEVRLSDKLIEPPGWSAPKGHPIIELAFSPDGKKIAATMDNHYQAGVWRTHLLIVDVQNPQAPFRQFDLETCGNDIAWSPDGGALLVCGRILRLNDGSSCDLAPMRDLAFPGVLGSRSFWLSADRVIGAHRSVADLSCRWVDTWEIAGNWDVAGTIPEEGWMLLRTSVKRAAADGGIQPFRDYAIADRDSHRLTSGMLLQAAEWDRSTIVSPGARAVCSALSVLHCWSLPGDEVIRLPPDLKDYLVTQASRSSPRVIAEHWRDYWWDLLGLLAGDGHMVSRIVVDLRSGRQIASLKPRPQHGYFPASHDWYFWCALSPAGDLLAEGGDGSLTLYRLP
jgi:WD40 repeat protein